MKYRISKISFFLFAVLLVLPVHALEDRKKTISTVGKGVIIEPDHLSYKAQADKATNPLGRDIAIGGNARGNGHINTRYVEGIDISHYQETIDWDEIARNAEISYVYIKASEGETLKDDYYIQNLQGARRAGLSVGSYHFYRPQVTPQAQLENMTQVVRREEQDLVPIIDIEKEDSDEAAFIDNLRQFILLVERYYGKKPLLYTYHNFYNRHFQGLFTNYHWMIARYRTDAPVLNDGKTYIMWQYTQSGRIPGIRGKVDRSRIMSGFTLHQLKL